MNPLWTTIARRIVEGVGVQPGELVQVRDHAGRFEVLEEVLLAIERVGATPFPELTSANYLERLLADTLHNHLDHWDHHRKSWMEQYHRIITLEGGEARLDAVPSEALEAWRRATHRLTVIEEARQLPYLLVAVPTERQAQRLEITLAELEAVVLPALAASITAIHSEIHRVFSVVENAQELLLRTGADCELRMLRGGRSLLSDDGYVDEADRERGAVVSNLPSGSLYTTVLEEATEGEVWLAQANTARNALLRFEGGRVTEIQAEEGREELEALFARHSGEPRRVSHIGIGLNPHLHQFIGWTLIDEHVHGAIFLALGENRYMGGQNESSLNMDFALADATFLADGQTILQKGKVVL
jgi:leucyl aminopeptidase (aminopeptidase T)